MTYKQQQQQFIQQHQQQVLNLLKWEEEEYNHNRYELGCQYLAVYFGKDQQAIDALSKRTEYWNWWNSMWNVRDEVFAESVTDTMQYGHILRMYNELHNVNQLVQEIGPPSVVLGKAFEKLNLVQL
jgi:hypothetical protein